MTPAPRTLWLKRLMDLGLAGVGTVLLAPVFLGIAGFIKLRSPGPVLFRQVRIGRDGAPFDLLKFRTMHVAAPGRATSTTTTRDDPRVYAGAHVLRRYKLDELPQLLNVLRGEMSLVGPRPTVAEDFARMDAVQRRRVAVPPGLTGLAQISGNTALSWPRRIALDLAYIDDLSVARDLSILWQTLRLVASGRSETHPLSGNEWDA